METQETVILDSFGSSKESAVEIKKGRQKKDILKTLFADKSYTIAELSDILYISIPSLTQHVEDLLIDGWLTGEEVDNKKQGRRPTYYSLNPNKKANLLIDISVNGVGLFLINFQNNIIFENSYDYVLEDSSKYLEGLLKLIDHFLKTYGNAGFEIVSAGVSMPGLVNSEININYTYPKIKLGSNGLCKSVLKKFGMPCFELNDSKATVNGEALFGLGADLSHVLSINMDWGIGLAVYTGGTIFTGANGFAGELGHIQVAPDGELCSCGKVGCLDTVTSAKSLLKSIKKGLKEGKVSLLSKYRDNLESIDMEMIIDAVQNGDEFAIDLLYNIGIEIGKGLSIAVHLFNPQIIIIDGILSKAGKFIVNPIEHSINKYCLPDFKNQLKIEVSQLGNSARLFGLNAFVAQNIFKND